MTVAMATRKQRRDGGLSGEDAELWDLVRQRFEPLKRGKERVVGAAGLKLPARGGAGDVSSGRSARAASASAHATRSAVAPPPAPAKPSKPSPIVEIERRKARKIAAGRLEIDATIDLHGMRQADAHAALRRFIREAQAAGKKFVKVITGKGAPQPVGDHLRHADAERGVLRRMVPLWLDQTDLRPLVVGIKPAGKGQGGGGALIIELRKPNKRV
jgi:DNA-nicking Smr family endonuclease